MCHWHMIKMLHDGQNLHMIKNFDNFDNFDQKYEFGETKVKFNFFWSLVILVCDINWDMTGSQVMGIMWLK